MKNNFQKKILCSCHVIEVTSLGSFEGKGKETLDTRAASASKERFRNQGPRWTHPVPSPSALVFCHAAALKPWE